MVGKLDAEIRAALDSENPAERLRAIAREAFGLGVSAASKRATDPRFPTLQDEIAAKIPNRYRDVLDQIKAILAGFMVEAIGPTDALTQIGTILL